MGSRDHRCPECGRGGMNDPTDAEIAKLRADLARLDKWSTPEPVPGETANTFRCDTCNGYRARGVPCAFCRTDLAAAQKGVAAQIKRIAQLHNDLAAANKIVEAAKAWREGLRAPLTESPVECTSWRAAVDIINEILAGRSPDGCEK